MEDKKLNEFVEKHEDFLKELNSLVKKRECLRKELRELADEADMPPEHEEMLRVFAFGLRMRGYELKDVLIASDAFATFMALWKDENIREIVLKLTNEAVGD